jgi:NAD-dependent deacetylase
MKKPNWVVLSGAGISAESGIPPFRGSQGLWESVKIDEVATPEAFKINPEKVHQFYNERRRVIAETKPNAGHIALAAAEKKWTIHTITQNIDDLHERAGSSRVLHLHGRIDEAKTTTEPIQIIKINYDLQASSCLANGQKLRPNVVWFGELVEAIPEAESIIQNADALLIVGTSLTVYPAAGLIHSLPSGRPMVIVDPEENLVFPATIHHIKKTAVDGIPEAIAYLESIFNEYNSSL